MGGSSDHCIVATRDEMREGGKEGGKESEKERETFEFQTAVLLRGGCGTGAGVQVHKSALGKPSG